MLDLAPLRADHVWSEPLCGSDQTCESALYIIVRADSPGWMDRSSDSIQLGSALVNRIADLVPSAPGGLLSWSLVLAFAAVFFTVLGLAAVFWPNGLRRRMTGPRTGSRDAAAGEPEPGIVRVAGKTRTGSGAGLGLAWALGPPILFALLLWLTGWPFAPQVAFYIAGVLWAAGFILPGRWRAWRLARRRNALRAGFPDALDMMLICVEAGLGLDAALNRVAAEIAPVHALIGAELTRVGQELRAGQDRGAALRGFARRAKLPEIDSFATLLIQSEALGTGIARTLKVQAEEMRAARMMRAEERAHTLPVKLTLPLVLCVLPAMIAVVLLPGIITIVRDVLPNLGS